MNRGILKINIKRANRIDWKIDDNLAVILNKIDIAPEKRVMFTDGDKQYLNDDGQIYQVQTLNNFNKIPLTKLGFVERTNEYMINQYTTKIDSIIDL